MMNMQHNSGGEVVVHGVKSISAEAKNFGSASWLWIRTIGDKEIKHTVTLFMPYETALEYAKAINTCNDRETAERKEAFDTLPDDYEAPH